MEDTQEVPDIGLNDFTYGEKPLGEWEEELTVNLPALPAHTQEIANCLVQLNNKYQLAYNCFTEIQVVCSAKEKALNAAKSAAIVSKIAEYKASGAKPPAKDILESLALAMPNCRVLLEDVRMYQLILEFFENHKTKLAKVMDICQAVLYAVRSADKMHDMGARQ